MLYVKTARLKSCCFSQTHKSKSKSHMLLSCTSSLLFNSSNQPADIHLFQDWGKKCALITGQDTVGDRCLQCFVQQLIFCLIIFGLAPQCVCFIWSRLSLLKRIWFYQSQAKFHLEISPRSPWEMDRFEPKMVPVQQNHKSVRLSGDLICHCCFNQKQVFHLLSFHTFQCL